MPPITRRDVLAAAAAAGVLVIGVLVTPVAGSTPRAGDEAAQPPPSATEVWEPVPPKIDAPANGVPSDATVLFAGSDTSAWEHADASEGTDTGKTEDRRPILWKVEDGALVVTPGSGDIRTREAFGDVQLHLEFRTLAQPTGEGQGASNSGVFFMERYELQVLDSYRNTTYVNGQAASVYKQYPPLVNASRPPGEWQSYDVLFLAPRFADDGRVLAPARMTVFHNGVLVQHDVALRGATVYRGQPKYEAHPAQLPLRLQDHGDAVAFRNIWIRAIERPVSP